MCKHQKPKDRKGGNFDLKNNCSEYIQHKTHKYATYIFMNINEQLVNIFINAAGSKKYILSLMNT